jgi:hypothetical protein
MLIAVTWLSEDEALVDQMTYGFSRTKVFWRRAAGFWLKLLLAANHKWSGTFSIHWSGSYM